MGVMRSLLRVVLVAAWMTVGANAAQAQEERTHTVQRKETAYGIATRYGVDLNRLFELNRWAEGGIRKGDVLRIPPALPAPETPAQDAPEAAPVGSTAPAASAAMSTDSVPDRPKRPTAGPIDAPAQPQKTEPVAVPRGRPVPPHWPGDTVRVAVMLPFSAGEDSLSRQALRLRDIALDCAAGIRTALDSGQWLGGHVDVRFLDTGLDTSGAMLCGPAELQFSGGPVDIAVGPLRRPALKEVRTWPGMEGAVHLVLTDLGWPLIKGAPGVLYPYTQQESKMALLAGHIAARHVGERVMMLATGDIRNIEAEDAFRAGWEEAGADSLTTFVEVEVTSRGLGSLRDSLTDVRRNILVAPGGKASRSFAGVLQTEIQLGDTMDFRLYTDGSWRDFEFLDPDLLDRVGMTVVDGTGSRPDSVSGAPPCDSLFMARNRRMAVLRGGPVGRYAWVSHDFLLEALRWTVAHGRSWPGRLAAGERLVAPRMVSGSMVHRFEWGAPFGEGNGLVNTASRLLRQEDLRWIELEGHE